MNIRQLIPVILLMTASCASPQVVTTLVPEAPEGHFEVGREYIPLENDSIIAELGFDGFYGDYLVFDLVVINRTGDTLPLQPSDFYYVVIDDPLADSSGVPPSPVMQPDRILAAYDRQLEEQEKQRSVNKALGFVDAGIGILATASAFMATDHPGYIADAVLGTLGTADHYVSNDRMFKAQLAALSSEKKVVAEELFRSTALPPGKVVNGFVYFQDWQGEGYLMFCFPVQDRLFQFVYRRERSVVVP